MVPCPRCQTDTMHQWTVAGALIVQDDAVLLVANRRRDGRLDWTPPGGVVDQGETPRQALTREVVEETGLIVDDWSELVYTVAVEFVDREMTLGVEVYRSATWTGSLTFDDPDGIVEEGVFADAAHAGRLLDSAPQWVREPVTDWLAGRVPPGTHFDYLARGADPRRLVVERR